ncbi:MAG: NAD-dependent epimerase/dehydratase family protein, partial [Chloroflexota bacterium]
GGRFAKPVRAGGEVLACLVTGIGYIGARLAERLLANGETVVGVDNFFATDRGTIARLERHPRFHFVKGTIISPRSLAQAFAIAQIDTVFALAAQASAHPDAATPRYTEVTNLLAPRLLLDEAVARGVRRFVYASSFRVYGSVEPWRADESSPYGAFGDLSHLSKVYVEKLLEMYARQQGLRCLPVRLGLVYGLSPVMKTDYRFMTAPNKFCLQAARGETLIVSEGGLLPQALLHVDDAASAMLLAAEMAEAPVYCPLNAAAEVASILDAARLVASEAERMGRRVAVEAPATPGEDYGERRVPSRLSEAGFRPSRSLAEGLQETLRHFLGGAAGGTA